MHKRAVLHVTITDLRRRYRWVVRESRKADVIVSKRGTPIFVLLSPRRFQQLMRQQQRLVVALGNGVP